MGATPLRDFVRWLTVVGMPLREKDEADAVLDQIRTIELIIAEYTAAEHTDRQRLNERLEEVFNALPDSQTMYIDEVTERKARSSSAAHTRFAEAYA